MNFLSEIDDRKERKKVEKIFKTNVLVPNKRACVDGATVAATPYLRLSWLSHQAGPAAFFHGCLQNSGKLH